MTKRVRQSLAANAISLIADDRVQLARRSFDDHAVVFHLYVAKLLRGARESSFQTVSVITLRTKTTTRIASFVNDLSHQLHHATDERLGRRVFRELIVGYVQLHRRADESLQERVVKILCDACGFSESLFETECELRVKLVQSPAIKSEQRKDSR